MSFEKLNFVYRPPATLPPSPLQLPEGAGLAEDPAGAPASACRADDLAAKSNDLVEANTYLQQTILGLCQGMAVSLDLNTTPQVSAALGRLYPSDPPPSKVSAEMFSNLLDAEYQAMALEMACGPDSAVEPNPIQVADLTTVTKAVEKELIATGRFKPNLLARLRALKGDSFVLQNLSVSLAQYPASRTLRDTSLTGEATASKAVDVSTDLYDNVDASLSACSSNYSNFYQMVAGPGTVEADLNRVLVQMLYQPLADLQKAASAFRSLTSLVHKVRLQDLADGLVHFAFVRLSAEVGGFLFRLDRYVSQVTAPFTQSFAGLGKLVGMVRASSQNAGTIVNGGLAGLTATSLYGSNAQIYARTLPGSSKVSSPEKAVEALSSLSSGLLAMAAHLDWACRVNDRKKRQIAESFSKLNASRQANQSSWLDLTKSLRDLESLSSLANNFVSQQQRGTSSTSSNLPAQNLETVGQVLSNLGKGNPTTVTLSGNQITVTPPQVPDPPAAARRAFLRGGLSSLRFEPVQMGVFNA